MLILTDRDQNVLFLEDIRLFCPSFDALISVTHRVALLPAGLRLLRWEVLGGLLKLGEELRIKDVNFGFQWLRNHVVLQETQVEQNQYIVEVYARLEELEIFLVDLHDAVQVTVDKFADHIVFFDLSELITVKIHTLVVSDKFLHIRR